MSGSAPTRFFYHSFPRRQPRTDEQGIAILRSIIQIGLVLVPEQTTWSELRSDGGYSSPDVVKSIRMCFTELAPWHLRQHATYFGDFALEFDVLTLRQLGALPVIYLPRETGRVGGADAIGAALTARVSQTLRLIDRLMKLKDASSPRRSGDTPPTIVLQWANSPKVSVATHDVANLLKILEAGIEPLEHLNAALRFLGSFFYPTENLRYNDILDYYRQREWRLGPGIVVEHQPWTKPINEEEKMQVMALDAEFFGGELEFRGKKFRRIDLCHVMAKHGSAPIVSLARRIVAPRRVLGRAEELLKGIDNPPQIVALEDFDGDTMEDAS